MKEYKGCRLGALAYGAVSNMDKDQWEEFVKAVNEKEWKYEDKNNI